jgi:gluconolactonase
MEFEAPQIDDPGMRDLLLPGAGLERLWSGGKWTEGPVYIPEQDALIWSDIPNNRMLRWSADSGATVFRAPSHFANGNTLDHQGRLLTCEHGRRLVSRTEADGSITVLVDRFEGKRFNSPNDLVVRSDGTIWFTDPDYGIISDYEGYLSPSEIGSNNVYCFDPASGQLRLVADSFDKPNGIAFSPCETRLYISDSSRSHDPTGRHHIRVFDVSADGVLSGGSVFAEIEPGMPDGLCLDEHGNLFTSAGDGVQVFSKSGRRLGRIPVPEVASNCTFGGVRGNTLFITATSSVYRIALNTVGARHGLRRGV